MKKLRIVLLGTLGAGKTLLYNKITASNETVRAGGDSVTQSIFLKPSISALGFEVLDTPGYQSETNKLLHAAAVVAALAEGELSRIIIVVKYERTDPMMKNIKLVLSSLQRFKNIITVVVTHWDQSQNKDSDKKSLEQKLSLININSVLYVSLQDCGQLICSQLDLVLKYSNFTTVMLTDQEIYSQFDLTSLTDETEDEINNSQVSIQIKFKKLSNQYKSYIKSFDTKKFNVVNVMHALIVSITEQAEQEVAKFIQKQGEKILQLVDTEGNNISFLYFIMLKKALFMDVEDVIMKAQEKMKQNGDHCYNYLKQCPGCGLIWMKVSGCDGLTSCGSRVGRDVDKIIKYGSQPGQVKAEVRNGQLIVNDPEDIFFIARWFKGWFGKKEMKQPTVLIQNQNPMKIQGCDRKFIWRELPPLSQNLLKQLLSPEIVEYFRKKDQIIQEEFQYLEKTYKELVNQAIFEQRKSIIRRQ